MKGELEIQAPTDSEASRALAFFLRAVGAGVFIWLTLNALAATPLIADIRW